jgi:formamidopyrimidine-DNA glycosylase
MPELPEVEVVRRGLARWVIGTTVSSVEVRHPRPLRRHLAGAEDFAARLAGVKLTDAVRRGKFLWLTLDSGEALLAHLGMSGQLVLTAPDAPPEPHLRVRLELTGGTGHQLRFVDQRMFGGLAVVPMTPTPDGLPGGLGVLPELVLPVPVAHIARDVLDPHLDEADLIARVRRRRTGIKRALLDQGLVSGIGNIYADEALWRARLHYARPTETLTRPALTTLLAATREVMIEALAAGGTSFDSLYVDVNGSSGYFERSLAVYGREGEPCPRCGTLVRRDVFMNRSSFTCPRCQPRPRRGRW